MPAMVDAACSSQTSHAAQQHNLGLVGVTSCVPLFCFNPYSIHICCHCSIAAQEVELEAAKTSVQQLREEAARKVICDAGLFLFGNKSSCHPVMSCTADGAVLKLYFDQHASCVLCIVGYSLLFLCRCLPTNLCCRGLNSRF
jgi:hypothetical protein